MKKLLILMVLLGLFTFAFAEVVTVGAGRNEVTVLSSDEMQTVIRYSVGRFNQTPVRIEGETYYHLTIEREGLTYEKGAPQLPHIANSIIIPDYAKMEVRVVESEYVEYDMKVAPSKGHLYRDVNPADVPYTFSEVYQQDQFYPADIASLGKPYIMRDFRGIVVSAYPMQYNPVTETLRVYTDLVLEVNNVGMDDVNVKHHREDSISRGFLPVYQSRFINFEQRRDRYQILDEEGRLIVITYDAFEDAMQPYVEWKRQKGMVTDIYPLSDVGSTANQIKDFISDEYYSDEGLTFVLLVGDAAQVPTFMVGGGGSDPSYSLLEGNDAYPEIFVGRFSAETETQVDTQVERTVHYERDIQDEDWLNKGMGVGSSQGSGIGHGGLSDIQHLNNIRDLLLDFTYVHVDQYYDPTVTSTMVANAVNDGRSLINYTGHGSTTSWGSSGFSNSDVNNLVNDNMLPNIISVACVNGNFTSATCFAEAWLRATNNQTGAPTGAATIYASTVNQSWAPPMIAQVHAMELLTGQEQTAAPSYPVDQVMRTTGGIYFNSSAAMIDYYGTNGESEFKNWHIFGDPSLKVRTDISEEMNVTHLPVLHIGLDFFEVNTGVEGALVSLTNEDNQIVGVGYTDDTGSVNLSLDNPPLQPMDLTLTVTAFNKITHVGEVQAVPAEGPFVIFDHYEIDDSAGNDNGLVDYGEHIELSLGVKNVGVEDATDVTVEISTDSEYITIIENSHFYGTVEPEEIVVMDNAFSFDVSYDVPDGYNAVFQLVAEGDEDTWETTFSIPVHAPVLEYVDFLVDDTQFGNGDMMFDPGETVELIVTFKNVGSADAYNAAATLSSSSPYIVVVEPGPMEYGDITPEEEAEFVFQATASFTTPEAHMAEFFVTANADHGIEADGEFDTQVGGYIIEEYFDEWLPEGWEVTSTGANVNWQQNNSNNAGGEEPEARFYWSPSTDATQRLISPEINTSGSESIDLEFKHYNNDFSGGYTLKLETSGDGGDTWTEVMVFPSTDFGPELEEITIDNDDVGSDQFRIAWTFDGDSWNINWWCIDDVIVGGVSTYEVAYFEGHVSLSGGNGDLTNVLVTAGDQMDYCDEDGFYSLAVLEGTYEITATLDDYVPMTVEDVSIAVGDTITVDFELEYITPPANLEYDLDFHEVTLMWEDAEVIRTDRAGRLSSSNQQLSASRERLTREQSRPLTHFNIYRSYEEDDFEMIGTSEETTYIDELDEGGYYQYYVTAVYNEEYESEPSNTVEIDVVDAGDDPIPMVTELSGNYPNPFNPETTISYSLKSEEHVVIDIYNIRGQKVKTLVDEQQTAGYHTVVWNGRDSNDRSVASGVYFSRMRTGKFTSAKKMILLK